MAAEDEPPTLTQIETIRNEFKEKITSIGSDLFDERDIDKLMKDNLYVSRFWIHAFFIPGDRVENAVNLVTDTFKWRKEFGVNDINESDLDMDLLNRGSLYYHNRDMKGSKLLVFCIRKHNKDAKKIETMKKMLIFILERLDKEEAGKRITIIFDSEGAGVSNFDLEQVKFLIHVLISYYPNFVEKILVFEMPWILNTAWKIIKSLLPPPAVARIKFVTKSNIKELISKDQLPITWGGEDTWEFDSSIFFAKSKELGDDSQGYKVIPGKVLVFSSSSPNSKHQVSDLTISNTGEMYLAVKVRTTNPTMFLVSPHTACLAPGQKISIRIQTNKSIDQVSQQQFQLAFIQTDNLLSSDQLSEQFANKSISARRMILRCQVDKITASTSSTFQGGDTSSTVQNGNIIVTLRDRVSSLEDRLYSLYQILALQGIIVIIAILYKIFL